MIEFFQRPGDFLSALPAALPAGKICPQPLQTLPMGVKGGRRQKRNSVLITERQSKKHRSAADSNHLSHLYEVGKEVVRSLLRVNVRPHITKRKVYFCDNA
jgi:hypothetical protein